MKVNYLTSLSASILALAMLVGCGGDAQTTSNPGGTGNDPQPETPADGDAAAATTNDNSKENAASIPEDFPKDIHIADGAQSSQFNEVGGKKNLILEYPASAIDAFVASYQKGMADKGWEEVTSSKLPIGTVTNYSKDERKCTISIGSPKDEKIRVAINL